MAFKCSAGMTCRTPAGTITNITADYEHDSLVEHDFIIPVSTSNKQCQISFPYANIKLVSLSANSACTVYTNDSSGGSPDDTIALTSTILAKMWAHDGKAGNLAANPFTADVAEFRVTNPSSSVEVTLKARILFDGTP